jgi:hypothetical protein
MIARAAFPEETYNRNNSDNTISHIIACAGTGSQRGECHDSLVFYNNGNTNYPADQEISWENPGSLVKESLFVTSHTTLLETSIRDHHERYF